MGNLLSYLKLKPVNYRDLYSYSLHGESMFLDMKVEPFLPLEIGLEYIFCTEELWEHSYKNLRKLVTANLALHLIASNEESLKGIGEVSFHKEEIKNGLMTEGPIIFFSAYLPIEGYKQAKDNLEHLDKLTIRVEFDGLENAFYDPHLFWSAKEFKTESENKFQAPLNDICMELCSKDYWSRT